MNEIKQRLEQLAQKNPSVNLMYRDYLASHPTIESYQDLCNVLVNVLEIMQIQSDMQVTRLKHLYETQVPPYLLTVNPDGTQTLEPYREPKVIHHDGSLIETIMPNGASILSRNG